MLLVIAWSMVLVLGAAYSLAVWLAHAVAVWALSGAAAVPDITSVVNSPLVQAWWTAWLPGEWSAAVQMTVSAIGPWVQSLLAAMPGLAHWLAPVAWVVWGLGMLALLVGGAVAHALFAAGRRSRRVAA